MDVDIPFLGSSVADADNECEENVMEECGENVIEAEAIFSDGVYNPQVATELKPKIGQVFETLYGAEIFYNAYAKQSGFSVRKWSETKAKGGSGEILRKEYVCYKQGNNTSSLENPEAKRRRGLLKENCKAKFTVLKSKSGTFLVRQFVEGHSHKLSTPQKTHLLRSHRKISIAQKCLSKQLGEVNIPTTQQFNLLAVQAGGLENVGCIERDLRNYERDQHNDLKGHDADMLKEYLQWEETKNPSFYYKLDNDELKLTRCFWADERSRKNYKLYGDVVVFDITYNTNRYGMIFAPIVGVNNHGQTIVLACAFLSDETTESFVWLFKQFLEVMPGDAPRMIITDQDPTMTKAISQMLPSTYHRYCSCHILTKFSEKLDAAKYNAYYGEFAKCIWDSKCTEEFELIWAELVERSSLHGNKWLQSIYAIRFKWVPVYVKHIFSADLSSSQRAESGHSFMKKFVGRKNSLVDFMVRFTRAQERQRHEALLADQKDVIEKPELRMNHSILRQMVGIYTCEMFFKFQDEFWECFDYKLRTITELDNGYGYKIQRKGVETDKGRELTIENNFAKCTCCKFESLGIPCRHILAYLLKFTDFDTLPSEYILKRWTKSTKSETIFDDSGMEIVDDRSYHLERSRLIECCLDAVDTALTSPETKKIFVDGLTSVVQEMKSLPISGTREKETNEAVDCGPSVEISAKRSCNVEPSYQEPSQVSFKGCGNRLKGGKEKAVLKALGNKEGRRCAGCGGRGLKHDRRNCPGPAADIVGDDDNGGEGRT